MTAKDTHVAFGIHEENGYHLHALTAIHSLLARSSSHITIHILHDITFATEHQRLFQKVASRFKAGMIFHDVTKQLKSLPATRGQKDFSIGCLFSLLIPKILPYFKTLYLDCDVVVNMDVNTLLQPLPVDNDYCLYTVSEVHSFHPAFRNYLDALGINRERYFN